MLNLYKKRRITLPTVVMAVAIIPAMIFAVNEITKTVDTSAVTYSIPSGYTTITDPNFYNCVANELIEEFPSETIPATGITNGQLAKIRELFCDKEFATPDEERISNTKGLEKMTALTYITIRYNKLTSIDLSNNTALRSLHISNNQLTSLDLSNNTALEVIDVADNQLTSLNTPNTTTLKEIWASDNQLTSLDLSNNTALEVISVPYNQISDISSMVKLSNVDINHPYSSFLEQRITATTNNKEYTLPTLFQAVNSTLNVPGMADWVSGLAGELTLYNATLNEDGKSITITDLAEPAQVRVKMGSGRAMGSQITVTYEEPGPETPEPGSEIPVPNTGEATASSDGTNTIYCVSFAVLMTVLGVGLYCHRGRKTHRKFER